MRPVADARDKAVFDRIDVAIFAVAAEILVVADQIFPEPALPDAAFAARDADRAARFGVRDGLREDDLDQPPAEQKSASSGGSVQTAWI